VTIPELTGRYMDAGTGNLVPAAGLGGDATSMTEGWCQWLSRWTPWWHRWLPGSPCHRIGRRSTRPPGTNRPGRAPRRRTEL